MEHGQLYTSGGSGSQDPGTSYAKITQWDTAGISSVNVTPDTANNKITVASTGIYVVMGQFSFAGANASIVNGVCFWNGVEQPQIAWERKLGSTDVGSASFMGIVDATTGNTDFDFRAKCNGATDDFDIKEAQLSVFRIGDT